MTQTIDTFYIPNELEKSPYRSDRTGMKSATSGSSYSSSSLTSATRSVTGGQSGSGSIETSETRGIWDAPDVETDLSDHNKPDEPLVLEHFLGQVTSIDGNRAVVSLKSSDGEVFVGDYDLNSMMDLGVGLGDWFDCETVATVSGTVEVRIQKRTRIMLSQKMIERMQSELDEALQGLE